MNSGSTPTPPDSEGLDPLLAALRQHLGDYGEAPPPAAWAAIRRQVASPPQPWWQHQRHLLPLLALLAGLQLVSIPTERAGHPPTSTGFSLRKPARPAGSPQFKSDITADAMGSARYVPTALPAAAGAKKQLATTSQPLSELIAATPKRFAKQPKLALAAGQPLAQARRSLGATAARTLTLAPAATLAGHTAKEKFAVQARAISAQQLARAVAQPKTAGLADHAHQRRLSPAPHPAVAAVSELLLANQLAAGSTKRHLPSFSQRSQAGHIGYSSPVLAASQLKEAARATHSQLSGTQEALLVLPPGFAERGSALDLLALKQPSLLLPEPGLALPFISAARPDSVLPAPMPVRRWALLALAGPTLSYRTLGPAPALAAGHPDFARLERPALGLGAQVQVRRVLSGRWALAVGAGYHEYATRLALSVKDSAVYKAVRQRDTYRLLTVPVQVTYALGVPRRQLSAGLLLGAEPGWYLGGRSTEGSNCGCGQQAYTSAAGSSYRPLSVAFSLGFDLRYRLGGPASRWQWLVQPTGRYVATPFVRREAVGFTRRQPFSLGLLTGFSWDIR